MICYFRMLLAFMYYYTDKNTHTLLKTTLPYHFWVTCGRSLKGHTRHRATHWSTCTILFQLRRNVGLHGKSEALPSCFVTNATSFQHWHYFFSVSNHPPMWTQPGHSCVSMQQCANTDEMYAYNMNYVCHILIQKTTFLPKLALLFIGV